MIGPSDELDSSTLDLSSFRDELRSLYDSIDDEVRRLGPRCDLSGRCCRFEEYGHTLFLSAPEAALLVAEAPQPTRKLDQGATCPWQDARGLCQAREARPIGCRVYFCDPSFDRLGPALGERYVGRLKAVVARLGLPWDYAPLHKHLRHLLDLSKDESDPPGPASSSELT